MPSSSYEQLLSCFPSVTSEGNEPSHPRTTGAYLLRARRFCDECGGTSGLPRVGAAEVTAAVLRAAGLSVGSGQYFVAALRSFLRYLFLGGVLDEDLSTSALAVTGRRRTSLPTGITRADAQRPLDSCDRRANRGRRDFAVLMVLLRLGLRAIEVAGLRLDDVDWSAGEITVSGKG